MDRMNFEIITKIKMEIKLNKNVQIFIAQKDILIQSSINKVSY